MNSSSLWKELAKSIKTFSQQASNIENTEDLDQLKELELTIANLQKTIHQLEYTLKSNSIDNIEIVHDVEEIAPHVNATQEEVVDQTFHEEELVEEKVEMPTENIAAGTEKEVQDSLKELNEQENVTEDEAVKELESQIGSLIEDHSSIINPSFGNTGSASLADKLGKTAIKDLTTAIGISEKFLFMNELFEGDSDSYKTCLEKLNSFNSFSEAKVFLNDNVITKYKWDDENEYVQRFYEVVERRYF